MCLDMQPVVTNSSDCSIKISYHRLPLGPLARVPIGILPIPKRIQRIQIPGKQRDIREIITFVELFIVKQPTD